MNTKHSLYVGIWSGSIAGIIFGAMLGMMGSLPLIARLADSDSSIIGFIIHLVISIILGGLFAILFKKRITQTVHAIIWGIIYGLVWWVLSSFLIIPWLLGATVSISAFSFSSALPSLWGHVFFGFVLGLMYSFMKKAQVYDVGCT